MTSKRANGIERALDLIAALAEANEPLSRAALAAQTQMPRSTVYSLSDLLISRGWLIEQQGGQLLLGPQAAFVSNRYLHQHGFDALARQILAELAQATGFMCEIDTVDQWDHIVAISEGRMAQGYLRPVEGARLPLMPTAAARILLADMSPQHIRAHVGADQLISATGQPFTWDEFFADVQKGKLQGFVTVCGWLGGSASTLACPVFGASGQIVGSLCLILPGASADPYLSSCLPHMQTAASKLTSLIQRIGWPAAERGKALMCEG